jgi:flagellin-like protein
MKILKSKKALSPVVASIILIAVTVAVSLAVAIWMGSLTTGQMQTEGISFVNYAWATPGNTTVPYIELKIRNTGSADLSIAEVRVDNTVMPAGNLSISLPYSLPKGSEVTIKITHTFQRGVTYNFYVRTSKGNVFGPYTLPAP